MAAPVNHLRDPAAPVDPAPARGGVDPATEDFQRANRAVRRFYQVKPQLEAFARVFTNNPKMYVLPTSGASCTDGKMIKMKVNAELGDEHLHDPMLCDKRDANDMLKCAACRANENMLVPLFHEIGHIIYDSFEAISDYQKQRAVEEAVAEAERYGVKGQRLEMVRARMAGKPPKTYVEAAARISPFLHPILNCLEDARVNELTMQARPGMRKMFAARTRAIFEEGIEQPDGSRVFWREQPRNAQVITGLLAMASGYSYEEWFTDEVVEALKDEQLRDLVLASTRAEAASELYRLGFPILNRLRELGFCSTPDDPDEEDDTVENKNVTPDQQDTGGNDDDEGAGDPDDEDPSGSDGPDEDGDGTQGDDDTSTGGTDPDADPDGADEEEDPDGADDGRPDGSPDDDEDDQEGEPSDDKAGMSAEEEGDERGGDEQDERRDDGSQSGGVPEDDDEGDPLDDLWDDDDEGAGASDYEDEDGEDEGAGEGDDDGPDEGSSGSSGGSAEDVEKVLKALGGHDDENHDHDPSSAVKEDDPDIERAIRQEQDFDAPSMNVHSVKVVETPADGAFNYPGNGFRPRDVEYTPHLQVLPVEESILQKSLGKMRLAFSENKKGSAERGRRSGRIHGASLGKRIPVGDDRVFQKRLQPGRRDYHVLLGLDISYSTNSRGRIQMIKTAAKAQADLLARCGVPFEIWAHSADLTSTPGSATGTYGGRMFGIVMHKVKGLTEQWDDRARARLDSLAPFQANLDGHTMEFYRKCLEKSDATDKVLMYYTDGDMPYENYTEELEILKREIRTLTRSGVEVVGVGITNSDPEKHGLDTVRVDVPADVAKVVAELHKRLT